MSKLRYLWVLLLLCAVGYVVVGQLDHATGTIYHLLSDEVNLRLEINIQTAYKQLKRYPDAGGEFQRLVLDPLELHRYPERLVIHGFTPGDTVTPASFQLKIGRPRKELTVSFLYYGSDYRSHLSYQGKLLLTQ